MGRSVRWVIAVCVVGVAWSAAWAQRDAESEDEDVHLGLSAGARFPVNASLGAELELPGRIRLSGGYGVVPKQFLGAVNRALVSFDAYRPDYGDFALQHVERTRVLSANLSWRPVAQSGFFIEGGYSAVMIRASVASRELIAGYAAPTAQSKQPADPGASGATTTTTSSAGGFEGLTLDTTMHMVTVQGGWEWRIGGLFIRGGVGGAFTAGAQSQLRYVNADGTREALGPIGDIAESDIDHALAKYAHTPFASVQVGYFFF